jgi:hypothetical protein
MRGEGIGRGVWGEERGRGSEVEEEEVERGEERGGRQGGQEGRNNTHNKIEGFLGARIKIQL